MMPDMDELETSSNQNAISGMIAGTSRGRGAATNRSGRFESSLREAATDDWYSEVPAPLKTTVTIDHPKSIITTNASPDVPFDRSINPYRGCEHGCSYCYARPSHAFAGLSPGLDFESRLFAKPNAPELLEKELSKKSYDPRPIAFGTNTDPYQPIEREWNITRSLLEVLERWNHPLTIVTKSALILRDLDILSRMAEKSLVKVALSVTTLDHRLARKMEPRATTPWKRIAAIRSLTQEGIPTGAMFAPVIPTLNDHELEAILEAVSDAGASEAHYIMLRLPMEVTNLFSEWLRQHYPNRAERVLNHVRAMRRGKTNDPGFHERMKGRGAYADLVSRRFHLAERRFGLNKTNIRLRTDQFCKPLEQQGQLALF